MIAMADCVAEDATGRCEREARTRGYCGMHYQRVMKNGHPGPVRSRLRPPDFESWLCPGCKQVKAREDYPVNNAAPGGRNWSCRSCLAARGKEAWRKHGDKKAAKRRLKTYGITPEEADAKLREQDGKCAICRSDLMDGPKRPSLDHDHRSGQNRGFLCNRCNIGIGYLADDPETLEAAARYIRRYRVPSGAPNGGEPAKPQGGQK